MKNLISKEEKDRIDLICDQYGIVNYSINSDGSVDVDGDVSIFNTDIVKLPLKFGKISGDFKCDFNLLTSLEGGPTTVGGDFNCSDNRLTSLKGAPNVVNGNFVCSGNIELTSLEGAPHTIGGDLFFEDTPIRSTYSGDIDIDFGGEIYPGKKIYKSLITNINHIKLILKYQRHFYIWNDDLTLNKKNFKDLIYEIEDGLE
jgi:hypothetical protein